MRLRGGDLEAHGVLFARHHSAAVRVAAKLTYGTRISAEDATSEAFLRTLGAIQAGKGPRESYRAYLYTVLRNYIADTAGRDSRSLTVDDFETVDAHILTPEMNPAVTAFESDVVRRAYASIPERWQAALWYSEVEGMKPGAIAPLLGLTANGTSALLFRAREGLRQAYLVAHLAAAEPGTECAAISPKLGAYERGKLTGRDRVRVQAHVESCADCTGMVTEVHEVNRGLLAVVVPAVLGGVGAAAFVPAPGGGHAFASESVGSGGAATATAGAGVAVSVVAVAGLVAVAAVAAPLAMGVYGSLPGGSAPVSQTHSGIEPVPHAGAPRAPVAEPLPEPPGTSGPAPGVPDEQGDVPAGPVRTSDAPDRAPGEGDTSLPGEPPLPPLPPNTAWGSHAAGAVGDLVTGSRGWVWLTSVPSEDTPVPTTITIELGDGVTGTGEVLADGADCTPGPVVACTIPPVPAGHETAVLFGVDVLAAPDMTVPVTVTAAGDPAGPVVTDLPVTGAGLTTSRITYGGFRASTASSTDPTLDVVGTVRSAELAITGPADTGLPPQAIQYAIRHAILQAPDGTLIWLTGGTSTMIDMFGGQRYFMTTFDVTDAVDRYGPGAWHAWSLAPDASWALHAVSEDEHARGLIEMRGAVTADPGAEVRMQLPTLPEGATARAYAVGASGWTELDAAVSHCELVISGGADGAIVQRVVVGW